MAKDKKLQRRLRKARGDFIKVAPIAEHSIKLSDIPIPTRPKLTRKQRQAAKLCRISEVEYARGLELMRRRAANA